MKRFRRNSLLSLNDEIYVFSEITIAQFHKIIKNRQIRICQIIDYELYDFENFVIMNVNIDSSTIKKFVSFETRDKNDNLLQIIINQFQTNNRQKNRQNLNQSKTVQKLIQLTTIQKSIRSLFFSNCNLIINHSTFHTSDAKNISFFDFVNVFSNRNDVQKRLNSVIEKNSKIHDMNNNWRNRDQISKND